MKRKSRFIRIYNAENDVLFAEINGNGQNYRTTLIEWANKTFYKLKEGSSNYYTQWPIQTGKKEFEVRTIASANQSYWSDEYIVIAKYYYQFV